MLSKSLSGLVLLLNLCVFVQNAFTHVEGFKVMAYYFEPESLPSLQREANRLDEVMFDLFSLKKNGGVSGSVPTAVSNSVAGTSDTYLTVANYGRNGFDGRRIHNVLSTMNLRNRLVDTLVTLVVDGNFDGLNIDFEAIYKGDRARYTLLIKTLYERLHPLGKKLAISVPAVEEDNPNDSWAGAFDYANLAPYIDILQLMTYDQNGPWGPPGPVSGLDWVEACVIYAKSVVGAGKVSMGVPAYGYLWNLKTKKGRTVPWTEMPGLLAGKNIQWDTKTSSPWVEWTAGGAKYVVWYENFESIRAKAALARQHQLHGVSVWALAHEDSSFWDALINV